MGGGERAARGDGEGGEGEVSFGAAEDRGLFPPRSFAPTFSARLPACLPALLPVRQPASACGELGEPVRLFDMSPSVRSICADRLVSRSVCQPACLPLSLSRPFTPLHSADQPLKSILRSYTLFSCPFAAAAISARAGKKSEKQHQQ